MVQAYLSDAIVAPDGVRSGALLVENGRILSLCEPHQIPPDSHQSDLRPSAILPGLVDTHVHINEPGRGDWEGFRTATRAAAAGGYTTLVDMPLNGLPETTTVHALEAKRQAAAGVCTVDWAAWGGCVADNQAHLGPLAQAGVCGFKAFLIYPGCEGFTMVDRAQLEAALPAIARTGLPLLVHAELDGPIAAAAPALANQDWRSYATYLASRPDQAELQAIRMLIDLCRQYRFRLHIVHLATALALDQLRAAKAEGLPITVETCPHYLYFAAEDIPDGSTLHKCAPPIRRRANREALWQGLRDGTIDLVATDHSPCPPVMKRLDEGRFDRAWGGIASLALALPVLWCEASRRGFSLSDLVRWMAVQPAHLAGLADRTAALQASRDATFVVFDPDAQWTVGPEDLYFRYPVTPYLGARLRGRVESTFLRGVEVFHRDAQGGGLFGDACTGQEHTL